MIESDLKLTAAAKQWDRVGVRHHHGVCVPLFSLRSQEGRGIGVYSDLIPLISWLKEVNFDIVQLLPINDTQGQPSPYSPVSSCALNPLYLDLNRLPNLVHTDKKKSIDAQLQLLDALPRVDYECIYRLKTEFLDEYAAQEGKEIVQTAGYQRFIQAHTWLKPYALYLSLAARFGTLSWEAWQNMPQEWEQLYAEYSRQIESHCLMQYLCWLQMAEVRRHADALGVQIKGDCPILISRNSADVWAHRHLFRLNYRAGAPPDYYNPAGQDWGFPLYNWEAHAQQKYAWWQQRLSVLESFCHLYRIDHVVGFYRIWARQKNDPGRFVPADPAVWIPEGESRLKALLQCSDMLPIGEDLGTVPAVVRQSLTALGICGTKVLRWETLAGDTAAYIPFSHYGPLSMSTVSTHDSETLAAWWQSHPDQAKGFSHLMGWQKRGRLTFDRHLQILKACHSTPSLFHINLLQEYLALFAPLVAADPADERINTPGKSGVGNWTYRMRPTLEEVAAHTELRQVMRECSSCLPHQLAGN